MTNKKRKPNNKSMTQQLLKEVGEEELYALWCKHSGMYGTARYLTRKLGYPVSAPVIRYISHICNWVREINDPSIIFVKGILRGTVPSSLYKHVRINIPGYTQKDENSGTNIQHRDQDESEINKDEFY